MAVSNDSRAPEPRQGAAGRQPARGRRPFVRKNVAAKVRDASDLLVKVMRVRLRPHGLSLNQYRLLREVWEDEGVTQRLIAERMHVSEPATAVTVDTLEDRGLIRRARADNDRRKSLIYLTKAGERMRAEVLAVNDDVNAAALAGLSSDDVDVMSRVLDRMTDNLVALERYLSPD